VIRRLFWMVAGALLGVSVYRRVGRLAHALTQGRLRGERAHAAWAGSVARFARDVRDGMELYADRHPRLAGRTLEGQQARAERGHEAGTGGEHRRGYPGIDYAKDGT
jgi:hypothetical protein